MSDRHYGRAKGLDYFLGFLVALVIGVWAIVFLGGCSTIKASGDTFALPDQNVYYYNDMNLSVNGTPCYAPGICTAKRATSYAIKIETKEEVDQIVVSTLKRTDTPAPDSIGKKKKGYVYTYTPGAIEKEAGVKLKISGYLKDKGQTSAGVIVFEHPEFVLTSGISCNSTPDYGANGIAICQAMKGQRMLIWFPREVHVSPRKLKKAEVVATETDEDRRCQIDKPEKATHWKIVLPARECEYLFTTDKEPYQQFLLYTVGAEEMPIRSE